MPTDQSDGAPTQTVESYMALVRLIRDEMDAAIKPLRDDIKELRDTSYSREMIDAMFRLRDERIARIQSVGGIIVGISTVLYVILVAMQAFHIIP